MQQYPLRKRASATQLPPHRAGHSINHYPEDMPYLSDQQKRYPNNPLDLADDLDYPEERIRMPTSAVRYVDMRGNQVIQRGRQRLVIHDELPPQRRKHWSLYIGIGMILMVLLFAGLYALSNWWTEHQVDATYGMPRTWQTDQVVGISDSSTHPSHFIFENLAGKVLIIFFPGGDASHARIYIGPRLFTDNADQVPVTGEFKDVGNGKLDMIVHIGDQRLVYLNTGSDFKPEA